MGYLDPQDYAAYGLEPETADALVTMASGLMDAHCRRPTLMAAQYTERVRLRAGATTVRLSYGPLAAGAVTAMRLRYGRTRALLPGVSPEAGWCLDRDGVTGMEIATAFGLPGMWSVLDVTTLDVYAGPLEISIPGHVLGIGYSEAEVTYTAGLVTVPDELKAACAQVVRNAVAMPALNVKSGRVDKLQMHYFGPTLLDETVRTLLKPYLAERLG